MQRTQTETKNEIPMSTEEKLMMEQMEIWNKK